MYMCICPYILFVPLTPIFHSVLPYRQLFLSYRAFCDNTLSDHKMTMNTTRSKVPHMHVYMLPVTLSPHFQLLTPRPFWNKFTDWLQNHIEVSRPKVSHIHSAARTSIPDPRYLQFFLIFLLHRVFKILVIFSFTFLHFKFHEVTIVSTATGNYSLFGDVTGNIDKKWLEYRIE